MAERIKKTNVGLLYPFFGGGGLGAGGVVMRGEYERLLVLPIIRFICIVSPI